MPAGDSIDWFSGVIAAMNKQSVRQTMLLSKVGRVSLGFAAASDMRAARPFTYRRPTLERGLMTPSRSVPERLGIELPIIQAPMAGVQGSALAIAVSNAGGLGSLPCALLSLDAMRAELMAS
jgi:hypothetical protein